MNQVDTDDILKEEIKSLHSLHIGLAIDEMREATDLMKDKDKSPDLLLVRRLAISSILHSFCSLEALISYLGFKRFESPESDDFLSLDDRGYFLNRYLKSWEKLNTIEKINGLHVSYCDDVLDQKIKDRLLELNNLRNWIVHGKVYSTVSLIEPIDAFPGGQGYYIIDEEISIKWKEKFPHCKFKEPHYLDHKDAQVALRIVIEVFLLLSNLTGHHFFFTTYYPSISANGLAGDMTADIDGILGIN
jgi:hypothetical protein